MTRLLVLLSFVAACSGSTSTQEAGLKLIQECSWPASITAGCEPRSIFQICEVPSGSSVKADGEIVTPDGGTATCDDACTAEEFSLTCNGSAPASSLGCKAVPIPTPAGTTIYCCPCGH